MSLPDPNNNPAAPHAAPAAPDPVAGASPDPAPGPGTDNGARPWNDYVILGLVAGCSAIVLIVMLWIIAEYALGYSTRDFVALDLFVQFAQSIAKYEIGAPFYLLAIGLLALLVKGRARDLVGPAPVLVTAACLIAVFAVLVGVGFNSFEILDVHSVNDELMTYDQTLDDVIANCPQEELVKCVDEFENGQALIAANASSALSALLLALFSWNIVQLLSLLKGEIVDFASDLLSRSTGGAG